MFYFMGDRNCAFRQLSEDRVVTHAAEHVEEVSGVTRPGRGCGAPGHRVRTVDSTPLRGPAVDHRGDSPSMS